jgi:predicted Zn-dependent protease
LIDAFTLIGQKAVEKYGSEKLNKLTDVFEGALSDITEKLIERGYDRKYEYEADRLSIKIASQTGYDPNSLVGFLEIMRQESSQKSAKGWFKTHPSASDRIQRAQKEVSSLTYKPEKALVRSMRFNKAVQGLK